MTNKNQNMVGLSATAAKELQYKYGKNELTPQKKENFLKKVVAIICEPMFLLLLVAAIIYFILGEPRDGAVMLIFVIGVISIDVLQEWRTDKTLHALKELSAPHIMVIRDGKEQMIDSVDIVPGDYMFVYEGVKIPADGPIVKCSDLCVNESSLTGEAQGVWKEKAGKKQVQSHYWRKDYCYAGTLVVQGSGVVLVEKIGASTEYGKIGMNVASAQEEKSPLQKQTANLVKLCAGVAAVLFVLVSLCTFFNISHYAIWDRLIKSILSGVTLAMAMIPEEFPVILTVFLSMGAWRLAKKQSLVRKLPSVETLGAVSVLCVDKTGTITMNQMKVEHVWSYECAEEVLIETMGLGCEPDTYDPMEVAMLACCEDHGIQKEKLFGGELISEYSFTHELKMMGHVWKRDDTYVIAAKGCPEQVLSLCTIGAEKIGGIYEQMDTMTKEGLRVIAVASMHLQKKEKIPANLEQCTLTFLGLIGLVDPPRDGIKNDIENCNRAGIRVVMITGDNGITASSIANKIGMVGVDDIITGNQINEMSDEQLGKVVECTQIYARVVPEHKMRIVKALKEKGEIVAMTGDGVNDAPALKYADIGIAMGKRGSEVSREAADLILMDDNFTTIVETIKDGRRIYDNIRKAVGYIFSIHIPIACSSLLAPILGIAPEALFLLPLHVVLLELFIDPTCSIVLERQPAEINIMERKPRTKEEKLLDSSILLKSVMQGFSIFLTSFGAYYIILEQGGENSETARTVGLVILILSNLFLVIVNSSSYSFAYESMKKLIKDKVMWLVCGISLSTILILLYTPVHKALKLEPLSFQLLMKSLILAMLAVFWYEIIKLLKKIRK